MGRLNRVAEAQVSDTTGGDESYGAGIKNKNQI
jgi:hypothetical protein